MGEANKTVKVRAITLERLKSWLKKDDVIDKGVDALIWCYENPTRFPILVKPHIRTHIYPKHTEEEEQDVIAFLTGKR